VFGCGERVRNRDGEFHIHHVNPHALNGPTTIDNALGLCWSCHRRVDHAALEGPTSRPSLWPWQEQAVVEAVSRLAIAGERFTVAAAPGSGKTRLASTVIGDLIEADHIRRVVVIVPTVQLAGQWAEEVGNDVQIWLDAKAGTSPFSMDTRYDGLSVTWASLAKQQTVLDHIEIANEIPTLFVFDEVHHAADRQAWGNAAKAFVNAIPTARFLNLSGTLFRSNPGELIAPVHYERDEEAMVVKADVTVTSDRLIKENILRNLEVYEFDSEVHGVDIESGANMASSLGIAGDNSQISAALRADDEWLTSFFAKWTMHLATQRAAHQDYPFKGLVIAATAERADRYHQILEEMLPGHHVWLAKSADGPAAKVALEDARKSRRPGILVAIAMASEGYDNPDLSSIAYLSNIKAGLRLAQIAGRVMRPTRREKQRGFNISGTVWLPAIPELVEAWSEVLWNELHIVELDELVCTRCGQPKPCECRVQVRICPNCGLPKPCACIFCPAWEPPAQSYAFSEPVLSGVSFNGTDLNLDAYEQLSSIFTKAGQGQLETHAAAVLHAFKAAGVVDIERLAHTVLKDKS
jgi:superfamily II DNA or RNA helicase